MVKPPCQHPVHTDFYSKHTDTLTYPVLSGTSNARDDNSDNMDSERWLYQLIRVNMLLSKIEQTRTFQIAFLAKIHKFFIKKVKKKWKRIL